MINYMELELRLTTLLVPNCWSMSYIASDFQSAMRKYFATNNQYFKKVLLKYPCSADNTDHNTATWKEDISWYVYNSYVHIAENAIPLYNPI